MSEALRLTFEYAEGRVDLLSVRRLAMRVPPASGPRPSHGGRPAVELRDETGQVLYRRVASVIPDSVEYPTGDSRRPWAHGPAPEHGTSSVLVPVDTRGRFVAIVGAPGTVQGHEVAQGEPPAMADLAVVPLGAEHYRARTDR